MQKIPGGIYKISQPLCEISAAPIDLHQKISTAGAKVPSSSLAGAIYLF